MRSCSTWLSAGSRNRPIANRSRRSSKPRPFALLLAAVVTLSLSGCKNPFDVLLEFLLIDLEWYDDVDLDLSVLGPDGEEITYFSDAGGGQHGGDDQGGAYSREYVTWEGASSGAYEVHIENNSGRPVDYELTIDTWDNDEEFTGTVGAGQTVSPVTVMVEDGQMSTVGGGSGGGGGGSGGGSGGTGLTTSAACSAHWRPILVGNGPNWKLSRLVWEGTDHYAPRDYADQNYLRFSTGSANRWTYEVMTGNVRQFNENSPYTISYDPSYASGVPCVLNYTNQLGTADKFALRSYSSGQLRLQWASAQEGVFADWYWVRN